jgi:hypothetical protein
VFLFIDFSTFEYFDIWKMRALVLLAVVCARAGEARLLLNHKRDDIGTDPVGDHPEGGGGTANDVDDLGEKQLEDSVQLVFGGVTTMTKRISSTRTSRLRKGETLPPGKSGGKAWRIGGGAKMGF